MLVSDFNAVKIFVFLILKSFWNISLIIQNKVKILFLDMFESNFTICHS